MVIVNSLNDLDVKEVGLLKYEDAANALEQDYIFNISDGIAWYLRDENGEDVLIADEESYSSFDDEDFWCSKDFDDFEYGGTGNRPAIYLNTSIPNASEGDRIKIKNESFTVIADKILLLDRYISTEPFDTNCNAYENSEIKERIDAWADTLK